MVFKRKNKKEDKAKQDKNVEADVLEAEVSDKKGSKAQPQAKELPEELKFTLKEFSDKYNGIFMPSDIAETRPDSIQLNILIAIYSELRLMRDLLEKED